MGKDRSRTAVGAGTTAGDAREEERAPESRAAEAEVDDSLESLRTTEAGPRGAPSAAPKAGSPAGHESGIRPEQPREDLRHNQAGIASRLDRTPPVK